MKTTSFLITFVVIAAAIALNICETNAFPAEVGLDFGLQADRFATGINGDEDLGDDINMKPWKFHFRK